MLFAQVVRSRSVPFKLSAEDDLVDVKRRNRILRELDDSEGW